MGLCGIQFQLLERNDGRYFEYATHKKNIYNEGRQFDLLVTTTSFKPTQKTKATHYNFFGLINALKRCLQRWIVK